MIDKRYSALHCVPVQEGSETNGRNFIFKCEPFSTRLQLWLRWLCTSPYSISSLVISEDPKARFFELHSCCRQYGSNFNHCDMWLAPKGTELGEIMQNSGHHAVQSHSRSLILVPMESLYATVWIIVTYFLSCTTSEIWQGCLSLMREENS